MMLPGTLYSGSMIEPGTLYGTGYSVNIALYSSPINTSIIQSIYFVDDGIFDVDYSYVEDEYEIYCK